MYENSLIKKISCNDSYSKESSFLKSPGKTLDVTFSTVSVVRSYLHKPLSNDP